MWRRRLILLKNPSPPTFLKSDFDEQIKLDIPRTFASEKWFEPHRDTLTNILNTFAATNEAFGYPQGVNYIAFVLYYVFYEDNKTTAAAMTLNGLQVVLAHILPLFPLNKDDASPVAYIKTLSHYVCLQAVRKEPQMSVLFSSEEYLLFVNSLICNMLPTLFSNVFSLQDTLLLWDTLFEDHCILKKALDIMVSLLLFQKNIFIHMPLDRAMQMFHILISQSLAATIS